MALIRSIENDKGRVTITLEDGTHWKILRSILVERPLQEGQELDPDEYEAWLAPRQYRSALKKAVDALALRPCSTGEIRKGLERIGYSHTTVDRVLARLASEHLLDDAAFARQWAESRARKYGSYRIRQELRMKGIDPDVIDEVLDGFSFDDQLSLAISIVQKGFRAAKAGEDPRKTSQRILASLNRKGFPYDLAKEALTRCMEEDE